jgi:ribosomal protein S18 acetylase RimI-like enzyme
MPSSATLKPRLPLYNEATAPSVGGSGENLQLYLDPVNSPRICERIGKETSVRFQYPLEVTRGQAFRTTFGSDSGLSTGRRFLFHDQDGSIIGALNITTLGRRHAVVSNIYVRPDRRGRGIASILVAAAKEDYPRLTVDHHQTVEGAAFFGYVADTAPAPPQEPEAQFRP